MNLFLETLWVILLYIYYHIESFVLLFVPSSYRRKSVTGQNVLVTGAGMGMGRLISLDFAKQGCTVVLWDINKAAVEKVSEEIKNSGGRAYSYVCDLSKRDDIYKMAERVKADVGDVDILVNNAGMVTGKKFLQCPDDMIQKTMDVNIMAHFWTCKAFMPAMLAKNQGHIVNIASSAGIVGVNGLADYCASKHAAVGFDESLRMELTSLGKSGVHTTVVCPFFINTGMFDGVKTRFPNILPILEPREAVNRIMNAVLTNQPVLMMPRSIYLIASLKWLAPSKALVLLADFFGASSSMDEFKGRKKQD